jgi:hypothetical protein
MPIFSDVVRRDFLVREFLIVKSEAAKQSSQSRKLGMILVVVPLSDAAASSLSRASTLF